MGKVVSHEPGGAAARMYGAAALVREDYPPSPPHPPVQAVIRLGEETSRNSSCFLFPPLHKRLVCLSAFIMLASARCGYLLLAGSRSPDFLFEHRSRVHLMRL